MRQATMRPAPGRSSRWRYSPAWAKTSTVIGAANFSHSAGPSRQSKPQRTSPSPVTTCRSTSAT